MAINRSSVTLVVSAIVGLAAVVVSAIWIRSHNASQLVQVVMATEEIDPGVKLRPEYLRLADWPKASVPHGAAHTTEALVGRVTRSAITPNEVIVERMLLPTGAAGSLAGVITPGMRAVTIPVSEVAGVAGFAMPGNFVDVLLSSKDDTGQPVSKIVLQRVLVLAIDQERAVKDESHGKVVNAVTLEVTPQQAEKLDVARAVGTLSLALRSQEDREPGTGAGARKGDFTLSQPATVSSQNGTPSVEVIRGTTRRIETGLNQ